MSTSDKLTYLNTTKSKIKQAINLAGASLTNEPFRQYSSKLYDSYLDILKNGTGSLYASMPKVTGTGTELSLKNTANLPMNLELSASESTQETTNDLNLFDSATIHSNSSVGSTGADYYDENSFATDYIDISQHNILICTGRSNSNNALWGALYDENKNFLEQVNYSSSANFNNKITINNSNAKYIRIGILKTYLANLFIGYYASPNPDYPQSINVVTGNNSITIEDENNTLSQTFSLSLGSLELAGIGDYKDKIFNNVPLNPLYDSSLVDGGWYKKKYVKKVVYDGSEDENWNVTATNQYAYTSDLASVILKPASNSTPYVGLCNLLKIKSYSDVYTNHSEGSSCSSGGNVNFHINNVTDADGFSVATWKTYLSNNNIILYYVLATPTTEQITDTTLVSQLNAIKNAISYDDETNISQTNANRPFIISASAVKNSME